MQTYSGDVAMGYYDRPRLNRSRARDSEKCHKPRRTWLLNAVMIVANACHWGCGAALIYNDSGAPDDALAGKLRRLRLPTTEVRALPDTGLSAEQETTILRAYSPVVLWDKADDSDLIEALVTPSYFVQAAAALQTPEGPVADFGAAKTEDRPKWLLEWVLANEDKAKSAWLDLPGDKGGPARNGPAGKKQDSTKRAINEKVPCVFGLVQPLSDDFWSVQYWLLFAYNNALNEGWHHEGDWLCLEVVVKRSEKPDGPVIAVFYHNHGKVIEALPDAIRFEDQSRMHARAYLEAGTNEPWPIPGDDGDSHEGTPGLYRSGDLGWAGLGDEFGIRPHNGTAAADGYKLNVGECVVNIRDESSLDAQLVRRFPGRWGGSGTRGNDSPQSPMFNQKMRNRDFGDW
jgi:hypothetical protein